MQRSRRQVLPRGSRILRSTAALCAAAAITAGGHVFLSGLHCPGRSAARVLARAATASQVSQAFDSFVERDVLGEVAQVAPFLSAGAREQFFKYWEEKPAREAVELETILPVVNDTVPVLWEKYRQLSTDFGVQRFRAKLDQSLRQAVQELIEKQQSATAHALADLDFEDESEAVEAWQLFERQFPKPAEMGSYMGTPTFEADIKYRFRRLKELMQIDSGTAIYILEKDCAILFVDPDFISRAFKAMCDGLEGGREEALKDLVLKHPGLLIADAEIVKAQLQQAKLMAVAIDATRGVFSWARGAIFDNGRKVPIGRQDDLPFGGGLPAWRRQWEAEANAREASKAEQ
ncbi:unnamed protein product [Polarella glacialis]|uniref:Uncharacterized protein n=1 Tax=Polarella glacialis TaxID=89957 RepID=A0A813E236_POLGL|nr:unnamed protein product [Polarella glacialis]|mmetsp:Transcript_6375/g.11949  ORF Transcript_6375/g.11949 Transcript_6375/m.11949 type:complete len:347 (-) Transcript_6375:69-1109(-)